MCMYSHTYIHTYTREDINERNKSLIFIMQTDVDFCDYVVFLTIGTNYHLLISIHSSICYKMVGDEFEVQQN